ncbi:MAG: TadE/TadG family protein [Afipia sp.]|nr:TadE/TadG family protein [Afipia sp.]
MTAHRVLERLSHVAAKFARAIDGNIAVIFAITMVPMMGFIGAAVDYSRAVNARTAMQTALDTAALMISKDASTLTAAQITSKAQGYFNALYTHSEVSNIAVTATYTPASGGSPAQVVMTGSAKMPTNFMKVAGYPTLDLGVSSTTKWGSTKMRVAMALDNTGSMASSGKITALQSAAKNLVDNLMATASSNGDVLISIVPFANVVNMGTSYRTSGYIDWSNWSTSGSIEEDYTCSTTYQAPTWQNGYTGKMKCGTANNNTSNWNGCVMDRTQPYDVQSDAPTTASAYFPADQSSYCPTQVFPLSYNTTQLKQTIDAMSPSGGTNQPIGLFHAWLTLLQQSPYNAPSKTAGVVYSDVIILMSDGLNTMDRWYGNGYSPSSQVDDRQALLCSNIKATGVLIYTIQVNTDGDPTSAILQSCASNNQFYPTTTASGIASAFDAIGTSLTKLRVAQ